MTDETQEETQTPADIVIPKVFHVGEDEDADFHPKEIENLVHKIKDWFISPDSKRSYEDPLQEARNKVEECLLGITANGEFWKNAPDQFAKRIRMKTGFDMSKEQEIRRAMEALAKRNEAKSAEEADALREIFENKHFTSPSEYLEAYQEVQQSDILQAYPELDTPAHRPNVKRLAMLYTEQERIRMELPGAKGKERADAISVLNTLQRTITDTMKSLDIHPDQINKRTASKADGSIGDLVAMLDEDDSFRDREKLWSLTLALQLWWMTQHKNGRGDGPQISEFEMWHMTRTRPIRHKCKCGYETVLVEGFTPEELKDYLIENGVLVETPVIPNLLSEEDLNGLSEYSGDQSSSDTEDLSGGTDGGGEQDSTEVPEGEG